MKAKNQRTVLIVHLEATQNYLCYKVLCLVLVYLCWISYDACI